MVKLNYVSEDLEGESVRELKFRAWRITSRNNEMIYIGDFKNNVENIKSLIDFKNHADEIKDIMQYTGIKSDDETDIYENDVVKIVGVSPCQNPIVFVGVVKFYDGEYVVESTEYSMVIPLFQEGSSIIILGNIYEDDGII